MNYKTKTSFNEFCMFSAIYATLQTPENILSLSLLQMKTELKTPTGLLFIAVFLLADTIMHFLDHIAISQPMLKIMS